MTFTAYSEKDLKAISVELLEYIQPHKILAFYGEMGVGKTTFISYLAKTMGVEEQVSSPTYGYVNEYVNKDFGKIYHFDLYRINSEEEAYNIGIEEYIYDENYVFLEWAENIENLLPEDYVRVEISKNQNGDRIIEVTL